MGTQAVVYHRMVQELMPMHRFPHPPWSILSLRVHFIGDVL
jgi:hypothetical protein